MLPDHSGRNIEDQVDVRRPVQTKHDAASVKAVAVEIDREGGWC